MKYLDLSLPEFVFLDANVHEGNLLEGRTVIEHIRSHTVLEVLGSELFSYHINENVPTFEFQYNNSFGVVEDMKFAVHFTLAGKEDLPEIFEKCREWYCNYCDWEDNNMLMDELGKDN